MLRFSSVRRATGAVIITLLSFPGPLWSQTAPADSNPADGNPEAPEQPAGESPVEGTATDDVKEEDASEESSAGSTPEDAPAAGPATPATTAEDSATAEPSAEEADASPAVGADASSANAQAAAEAPGAKGSLSGRVVLAKTGEPVADAYIYVRGTAHQTKTDAQGRFALELPVGVYDLSVVHANYVTSGRERVRLRVQQATQVRFALAPSPTSPDDFVITAKYVKGGVAQLMEQRRNATSVQDAIGAEDISKSPDSTASAATRRVVGATIVGGQFLLVRGLGGRYSNVRLNGVPLPSTDPDLPGFQIDLFPASLLSNLTISKTFSADIPGDFAGGSLNVVTRDFPDKFTLGASLGATYNTQTTFRKTLSYDGGNTDWLGFDDGTRALPKGVPSERVIGGRVGLDDEVVIRTAKLFPNKWKLTHSTALPNLSLGLNLGDTTKLSGRKFGYLMTLGYRANTQRYIEDISSVQLSGTGANQVAVAGDHLKREVADEEAQIGVLGTASFEPADNQKLTVVSLLTQTANDRTSLVTGAPESSSGNEISATQFRFVERQLLFNQLLGEHKNIAGGLKIDWQLNMALVARDQPDSRDLVYSNAGDGFLWTSSAGSGERLYSALGQQDFGGGVDLTFPLSATIAKAGYLGRVSSRDFTARRFGVDTTRAVTLADRALPAEEFFDPSNFDEPDPTLSFEERTQQSDGYNAEQDAHAGYAMLDVPFFSDALRVLPGIRAEWFSQKIESASPFASATEEVEGTDRQDFDWLPAAAAVLNLTDKMALRAAYGGTVARPLLRELSPFLSQDYIRKRTIQGNPELKRTFIHNFDLRWEAFPSATEVVAVSGFYKVFKDPIESVILDTEGNLTFENIKGATNYGLELEGRFSLGRLADGLENFSALANLALIVSNIELYAEQQGTATSKERPLVGQSPYVANLALSYNHEPSGFSANVYYNVFGRRIQDSGRNNLPDIYEEPFHSLDVAAFCKLSEHLTLGFSGTNVLIQPVVVKQGPVNYSYANRGSNYGLKLAWNY